MLERTIYCVGEFCGGYYHRNGSDTFDGTLSSTISQCQRLFKPTISAENDEEIAVVTHVLISTSVDNKFCEGLHNFSIK